jgi:hypothetical protein
MQKELSAEHPAHAIQILGVNAVDLESGNEGMCQGRTLPWLQDTHDQQVWESWQVTWRDVVILDRENRLVAVYNLTEHDLARTAARDSLAALLRAAAAK